MPRFAHAALAIAVLVLGALIIVPSAHQFILTADFIQRSR